MGRVWIKDIIIVLKMTKLTVFIFVIVLAVAAAGVIKPLTEERKDKLRKAQVKCQSDPTTFLDDSSYHKLRAGEKVDNPKLGAHLLCFSKGIKLQNENGDLNTDDIKATFAEYYDGEELTKLYECLVQKETPEKTAIHLIACQFKVIDEYEH